MRTYETGATAVERKISHQHSDTKD